MQFIYKAQSQKGETKSGTIEAKDKHELAQILRQGGYVLTYAEKIGAKDEKKDSFFKSIINKISPISLTSKMLFARHLSVMIGAGLSLTRALEILQQQTTSKRFQKTISLLKEDVTRGEDFGSSLAKYPRIFSELFMNMVKASETAGNLQETLDLLAIQLKKEYDLRSKIKSALFYPLVIITAMAGIGILMMIVVIPKLITTFKELNVDLPFLTRFTINFSTFLMNWGLYLIPALAGIFLLLKYVIKSRRLKKYLDWFFLNLPVLGNLIKKINSAIFSRTLSSLISSGTPIVKSMKITSRTVNNQYYRRSLEEAAEQVQKGKSLMESLSQYQKLFPPLVYQMIGVGEETGTLDDILRKLADFYEEEVATATKNLSVIIEPILMIIVGAIVGFFAVSMIQPMYSMMNTL